MAPAQKKQKTGNTEKELEDLLFGDVTEDIWDKAGHELEEQEEEDTQAFNDESNEEDEEDIEQTFFFDSGPITETETHTKPDSDDEIDYEAEEEMKEQGTSDEDSQDSDDSEGDSDDSDNEGFRVKGAWEDEDDTRLKVSLVGSNITKKLRNDIDEDVISGVEYARRLRKQFLKIYPEPEWARLPSEIKQEQRKRKSRDSDDDESENEGDEDQLEDEERLDLLKSTMGILERRGHYKMISQSHLDIMRLKDVNVQVKSVKKISSIAFHPNAQVLMTAGLDRTLRLFQVDGKINPKIQSVFFKDMPIHHAEFHPSGNEIILAGRRKYFYIYDIQSGVIDRCPGIWGKDEQSLENFSISPCGKYIGFCGTSGKIILVSYLTKKWVADLKVNKVVQSIDWSSDGKYLFAFNNDGEVYQFNVETRECVKRWMDDGCIGASVIRVSPNEKYYATGSGTGIVNVYDRSVLQPDITRPKPIKAVGNLTTRISNVIFNHDSQLMVIASRTKKDKLKVVHIPSGNVYANWPTERTPLGHIVSMAFSPNSDYLAVANNRGQVRLFTLKHYALK